MRIQQTLSSQTSFEKHEPKSNWGYIDSQPKGKMEIPDESTMAIVSLKSDTHTPLRSDAVFRPRWAELLLVIVLSFCMALVSALVERRIQVSSSLFQLSDLVGPTTESLLQGKGLLVCTQAMGTPGNPICFRSARMPLPSLVIASGIELFGNRFFAVDLFKIVLFLIPLWIAMYCVWRAFSGRLGPWIFLLLLVPFALPGFLGDVANLQVEEGYTYSFLALTTAIILFLPDAEKRRTVWLTCFALSVDGLYLAKSSMILAAAGLLLAFCLSLRRAGDIVLVAVLVAAAPLTWGLVQYHAGGHFSLGTSLDGINLHKGNNPAFLDRYPPQPGTSLDQFDSDLNRGLHFNDEWSFDDFHKQAAVAYIRTHPMETLRADARKAEVFSLSLTKYGSAASHGLAAVLDSIGMVFFRFLLWCALAISLYSVASGKGIGRQNGCFFLLLVVACGLPYILGFAYTRHAVVLFYPAALLCCCFVKPRSNGFAVSQPPAPMHRRSLHGLTG